MFLKSLYVVRYTVEPAFGLGTHPAHLKLSVHAYLSFREYQRETPDSKGRSEKRKRDYAGKISKPGEGGGLSPNPTSRCPLTKLFLACQNHSAVLKHVLQKRGINLNTSRYFLLGKSRGNARNVPIKY